MHTHCEGKVPKGSKIIQFITFKGDFLVLSESANRSYTVNIYRYKTIEANGNTGVIPTTSKSFSLYRELPFFGKLPIEAKGIPDIG